jgi:hypothetical protein
VVAHPYVDLSAMYVGEPSHGENAHALVPWADGWRKPGRFGKARCDLSVAEEQGTRPAAVLCARRADSELVDYP